MLGVSRDQGVVFFLDLDHVLELGEALLELFLGWGVLTHVADQLHGVQAGLVVLVVQQRDDLVQLVEVIDLHLALLVLSKRCQSSCRGSSHFRNRICQHHGKWRDRVFFDGLLLS